MIAVWLRGAGVARSREVWVLGGIFGLVPSTLGASPVVAVAIGLCGLVLVRPWRLRLAVALFVTAELAGLPWPAAPFLGAAAWFAFNGVPAAVPHRGFGARDVPC